MKAVKITLNNRDMLAARFFVDSADYDDRLPLDYYLVTDFGNDDTFDVVTQEVLDENFVSGSYLQNGFFEVAKI